MPSSVVNSSDGAKDDPAASLDDHHAQMHGILKNILNHTIHKSISSNESPLSNSHQEPILVTQNPQLFSGNHESQARHHLAPQQINTLIYICLAALCVFVVGTLSTIYVKKVRDKQRNRATLRGLLDVMGTSSNSDTNSNCDRSGGDSASSNGKNMFNESTGSNGSIFSDGSSGYTIPSPAVSSGDSAVISMSIANRRQSRLLLEPIGVEGFPAPHLSAPTLPPIKAEKKVRERTEEDLKHAIPRPKPGQVPTEADQAALAHKNLAAIGRALNNGDSAASFPEECSNDAVIIGRHNNTSFEDMIAVNNARNVPASLEAQNGVGSFKIW